MGEAGVGCVMPLLQCHISLRGAGCSERFVEARKKASAWKEEGFLPAP